MLDCRLCSWWIWTAFRFVHNPRTVTQNKDVIFARGAHIAIYRHFTFCDFKTSFTQDGMTGYTTRPYNCTCMDFFTIVANNKAILFTFLDFRADSEFYPTRFQ